MTYVAQFIKEFSGIGDEKEDSPQVNILVSVGLLLSLTLKTEVRLK